MFENVKRLNGELSNLSHTKISGIIKSAKGLSLSVEGLNKLASIGDRCNIKLKDKNVKGEIVGFDETTSIVMPYDRLDGFSQGLTVTKENISHPYPHESWLGRVINYLGEPIDGRGELIKGQIPYPLKNTPPSAFERKQMGERIDTGMNLFNTMLPICRGQRLGIFAGSGVGKSTLLGSFAKHINTDVNVIGLIGERGREVVDFVKDVLGEEGLKKSIVIVATSDQTPLARRQASYLTASVSEFFRDQGKQVLCMIDSLTRFAMAQREIGLSAGEPPTTKAYPPSVFPELSSLLERTGPGKDDGKQGDITGVFTVLVDGDDHDEPISDAVRGIIDGHIVLDRSIAERGRYPAVNLLKSVSRSLPGCHNDKENSLLKEARKYLSDFDDMEKMIRMGAYRKGSDPNTDKAIELAPKIEEIFSQKLNEKPIHIKDSFDTLSSILK